MLMKKQEIMKTKHNINLCLVNHFKTRNRVVSITYKKVGRFFFLLKCAPWLRSLGSIQQTMWRHLTSAWWVVGAGQRPRDRGLWTSSISIFCELVRNEESQMPLRPTQSESAFQSDPQVIHILSKVWKALLKPLRPSLNMQH